MKFKPLVSLLLFLNTCCFAQAVKPLDIMLTDYPYPFPVHFINLNIQQQDVQMAYMDVASGKPGGDVVLLLHGKNFCGTYWKQTADTLSTLGYRVIIPDQVGFGKSSKPQHIQYSFQLLAELTKVLLDSLHLTTLVVVGHSMGGMLATRFALMYPQVTTKLVLEDPIGLEDWKVKVPYLSVDDWYIKELAQSYDKLKKYERENYYHGTWKPEYEQWLEIPAGWTMNSNYAQIAWNSALTYDMIFTQPVLYEFENITVPTLLIIGELDRTAIGKDLVNEETKKSLGDYPKLGKEVAKKIKNCKLVEIPGVGHIPHVESFDIYMKALLPFLKN